MQPQERLRNVIVAQPSTMSAGMSKLETPFKWQRDRHAISVTPADVKPKCQSCRNWFMTPSATLSDASYAVRRAVQKGGDEIPADVMVVESPESNVLKLMDSKKVGDSKADNESPSSEDSATTVSVPSESSPGKTSLRACCTSST